MNAFLVWLEYNRATSRTCRQLHLAVSRTDSAAQTEDLDQLESLVVNGSLDHEERAKLQQLWDDAFTRYTEWECGVWLDHRDAQTEFERLLSLRG